MQSGLQTQHSGPRLECCLARVAPCYVVCPLSIPTLLRVLNAPDIFFGIRAATAVLNGSWLVNAGDGWVVAGNKVSTLPAPAWSRMSPLRIFIVNFLPGPLHVRGHQLTAIRSTW